jgi:hypothetical protein
VKIDTRASETTTPTAFLETCKAARATEPRGIIMLEAGFVLTHVFFE